MNGETRTPALTAADHQSFLRHGFVIVKNAVPQETITAAVEALERGGFEGKVGAADYQPIHHTAVDACVTDTVLDAIGELFGPAYPFARSRHATDMPRPYEQGAQWKSQVVHVDDDYPTLMPAGWALGMFIFLTPVRSHGGAFTYAPGSPYRYRPLMAGNPEWLFFYTARAGVAGPAQEYLAEPGDVLLFHHLMAHAGSNNVSDPATRHALLSRWHPHRRIVPGAKAFEQMSTIERANSTRFLQQDDPTVHALAAALDDRVSNALREGFGPPGGVGAQAVIRYEGVSHLLYTDAASPAMIRHAHSHDWATWEEETPLPAQGNVRALSVFRQEEDVLLFVGADSQTQIQASHDLREWRQIAALADTAAAAGHASTDYGSKRARGNVVIAIAPSDPSAVVARWGSAWTEAATWEGATRAAVAPAGARVIDALVKPVLGESEFALIADLQEHNTPVTRPFYALSPDSADYPGPLRPLPFSAPTPPRGVRVYARARRYWLVTYCRDHGGRQRVFWGIIDWEQETPLLDELTGAAALEEALCVVGIL